MNGKKIAAALLALLALHSYAQECRFKSQESLGREILDELRREGISCHKQKVHLTFDDGPTLQVTPALLNELNLRGVKASFFITTTNLRTSSAGSALQEMMRSGHLIANHGYDHNAYDLRMDASGRILENGFTQTQREQQIERSISLLDQSTNNRFSSQSIKLFRFPYGRGAMPSALELNEMEKRGVIKFSSNNFSSRLSEYRNQSPALQTLAGFGFSHLGWNHDSQDSSLPVQMPGPSVLKNYILKNIKTMCGAKSTRVALFHDTKHANISAIPVILDVGSCLGLKFISAEEMMKENSLENSGVLIKRDKTLKAPVDELATLLSSLEKNKAPQVDCKEEVQKDCYSEYLKRSFRNCEGQESICIDGRWYSRRDPMVLLNCNISD